MSYQDAASFRQALEQRLKNQAADTGLGLARLRKRVAFEAFLRRLLIAAPDRWVLQGALALDYRLDTPTRPTKDIDLGRDDDEDAAVRDIVTAQELVLDDFFTFAARRTTELDDTDEFTAIRFHLTAQLGGRTFEQFLLDIGFVDSIDYQPIPCRAPAYSRSPASPADAAGHPDRATPGREDPRLHRHLRKGRTCEHPAEGPRRHPADRSLDNDRGHAATRGTRTHLPRAPTPPVTRQTARAARRLDRPIPAARRGCQRGD